MDSTIHSDLIRGHIDTIILKALYDGDRYGFDIIKEIEQKSSGQYVLKQPTLYSCLKRLEVQGFIKSYWGSRSGGGRRKYFTLTDMGRDLFLRNQNEWVYSRTVIDRLISDRDVDLSSFPAAATAEATTTEETFDATAESAAFEDAANGEDTPSEDQTAEFTEAAAKQAEPDHDEVATDTADAETSAEGGESEQTDTTGEQGETQAESDSDSVMEEPVLPPQFVDTTSLMEEIFRQQLRGESYSENLSTATYTPPETFDSSSYFNDGYDEEEQAEPMVVPDGDATYDTEEIIRKINDARASSDSRQPDFPREETETEDTDYSDQAASGQDAASAQDADSQQAQPSQPDFYSYDSMVPGSDEAAIYIGREYKNILTELRDRNLAETIIPPETSKEEQQPEAEEETPEEIYEEYSEEAERDDGPQPLSPEELRDKKFKQLESQLRTLGDDVKIRTHNSSTSKQYSNAYYFYSNKLMLSHYLVLFLLMILEVSITYIVVSLSGIKQAPGWGALTFFIIGIILSALFPIVAFIKNLKAPNKTKRITFDFKMSMIFRCIVMAEVLLLVYLLNVALLGMPLTFGADHLTTLLIPALLSTNIPVSSWIFHSMYKSGKYSVES